MATHWQLAVIALCLLVATPSTHADIYRSDNGEMIPGTEGIEPEPCRGTMAASAYSPADSPNIEGPVTGFFVESAAQLTEGGTEQ